MKKQDEIIMLTLGTVASILMFTVAAINQDFIRALIGVAGTLGGIACILMYAMDEVTETLSRISK